jgi:hypothetical protein
MGPLRKGNILLLSSDICSQKSNDDRIVLVLPVSV